MRTVSTLPLEVREESHVWIPLSDGTRLAATVWRPVSSDDDPVPAILEFIPYRKRDLTARRDSMHHPYMAGHGYACARVDLRGSGDSDGVLTDEYLEGEFRDAEEVLAWLADQPWCSGSTGMMGISWGGFNALQVAARQPESLGAVISVCASDDRYADDVHYMGGCLLSDNLSWASTMFAYNSCPPDPSVVGERWRSMWEERLEGSGLWLQSWLQHQRRDEFWRHGSICEDYASVRCPVLAVSGWADGYSNAVFRLLSELDVPCEGLIGPWSHKYPHLGQPGPAVGFLQEAVRWWDRWLKGVDDGSGERRPALCTWMQESVPPSTAYDERPGRWVGEPSWPSPLVSAVRHPLAPHRILPPDAELDPGEQDPTVSVASPLSVGQYAGKWCSYNAPPDLPYDQREEDGGSITFDTDVLAERREILGAPVVDLDLEVSEPVAMVAARLSDVAPDGAATRVTYGLLNLTHLDGHDRPGPLEPGKRYRVSVALNGVAQAFPPGHRIRVSLSTSYWPLAWPPPRPVYLTVHTAGSSVVLPDRPRGQAEEPEVRPFDEPEAAPPIESDQVVPGEQRWTVSRDLTDYRSALEVVKDLGRVHLPDVDLHLTRSAWERYSWSGDDFDSVRGEIVWHMGFERGSWRARTVTRTVLTSDEHEFHLHAQLDAYEDDRRVFSQNWNHSIPRDHV